MTPLHAFAFIACLALAGVVVIALYLTRQAIRTTTPQSRPRTHPVYHNKATYPVPQCGHTIHGNDPWDLILAHNAHLDECVGMRKEITRND